MKRIVLCNKDCRPVPQFEVPTLKQLAAPGQSDGDLRWCGVGDVHTIEDEQIAGEGYYAGRARCKSRRSPSQDFDKVRITTQQTY